MGKHRPLLLESEGKFPDIWKELPNWQ